MQVYKFIKYKEGKKNDKSQRNSYSSQIRYGTKKVIEKYDKIKKFRRTMKNEYNHLIKMSAFKSSKFFEEENKKKINNNNNTVKNIKSKKSNITNKEFIQFTSKKYLYNKYNGYYNYTINKKLSHNSEENYNIYDYFQVNNILNNKRCNLKIILDELNYFYNVEEYLIDFYRNKIECKNILKFIITFFYINNKYNINFNLPKKNKYKINNFKDFIKIMIQKDENNIFYKKSILLNVIRKIKEIKNKSYSKESIINGNSFDEVNKLLEFDNKDLILINLEEYFNYLQILTNIPLISCNCILPNYFCLDHQTIIYLKKYLLNKRNEANQVFYKKRILSEMSRLKKRNIANYSILFNDSIIKSKYISFYNKDEYYELDNYNMGSIIKNKNKRKEEVVRPQYDNKINDIQNLIFNMNIFNKKKKKAVVSFDINKSKGKNILEEKNKNINKNISAYQIENRNKYNNSGGILRLKNNKKKKNNINYYKKIIERKKRSNVNSNSFKKSESPNKIINNCKNYEYPLSDRRDYSLLNNESFKFIYKNDINLSSSFFSKSNEKDKEIMRKINSARNNFYFKNTKLFIIKNYESIRKSNLKNIKLKNVDITNFGQKSKDFFMKIKHIYNYPPLKSEDIKNNAWENENIKVKDMNLENNYKKIIKRKMIEKNKLYENMDKKKFNLTYLTKRGDIYL